MLIRKKNLAPERDSGRERERERERDFGGGEKQKSLAVIINLKDLSILGIM